MIRSKSHRCNARRADGQPCRAWAIRNSDPPLCASHSGRTRGRSQVQSQASTLAGGGETVEALERLGLVSELDFVSTGGGAMLTFLSEQEMPGLNILKI